MSRGRLFNSNGRYLGQVNNFYTISGEFRMTLELDNGNTLQFDPGELLRDRQGGLACSEFKRARLGFASLCPLG